MRSLFLCRVPFRGGSGILSAPERILLNADWNLYMKNGVLSKAFNIRTDEYKKARYLIAFFFAVGFYFTFLGSISISVFDIRFGAKYLPYILFLFPALNLLFSLVYMKILPKVSKRKLFRYFMLFVLLIHITQSLR